MATSDDLEFYQVQFDKTWQMLVNQTVSKFQRLTRASPITGKERVFNFLSGSEELSPTNERLGDTIWSTWDKRARRIRYQLYDRTDPIDPNDADLLGELVTPKSGFMTGQIAMVNRRKDLTILDALGGSIDEGLDTITSVALPSAQKVDVNYVRTGSAQDSNMTFAKIIRADEVFGQGFMKEEPGGEFVLAIAQSQMSALLHDVDQVSNTHYAEAKALVDGKVNSFMGFRIIQSELLPLNTSTNVRTCYAYRTDRIAFADGPRSTWVSERPDKKYAWQTHIKYKCAAGRLEDEGVVQIECDEDE
jgi:hypothetical protein